MNLKPLLKGQKIRVDVHGHSEVKKWEDKQYEIHLHKETKSEIEGKLHKFDVIVPLNRDDNVRCRKENHKVDLPRKLEKEIQSAFSDRDLRVQFVQDLNQELQKYPSNNGDEHKMRDSLKRIGNAFGINSLDETCITDFYSVGDKEKTYNLIVSEGKDECYKISGNQSEVTLQDWKQTITRKIITDKTKH